MKKIIVLLVPSLFFIQLSSMEQREHKRKRGQTEETNPEETVTKSAKIQDACWQALARETRELVFHWAAVLDEPFKGLKALNTLAQVDRESSSAIRGEAFLKRIIQTWLEKYPEDLERQLYLIFCRACLYGKEPFFSMLKDAGVPLKDEFFCASVLYYALKGKQKKCAEELIQAGAEVPCESLDLCCEDLQLNELILKESTMIVPAGLGSLARNLLTAIIRGQNERVINLLGQGANALAYDHREFTTLMFACMTNNIEMVTLLLSKSVDTELKNCKGETALLLAVERGFYAIAELLLARGADVNTMDRIGTCPIYTAAGNNNLEMVKLLVQYGAQIDYAPLEISYTPLAHAVRNNNREMIEFLLAHGAAINAVFGDSTALHVACDGQDIELVQLLLANGAAVNVDTDGLRPLKHAINHGNTKMVKLLLAHKADPNGEVDDSYRPLMCAAKIGKRKIVRILLKHGAEKNMRNTHGETALDIAKKNGHNDCASAIETYMAVSDMLTGDM